jgi:NodT family efflux transporter outer membrane factor (OMF) lipoprotein
MSRSAISLVVAAAGAGAGLLAGCNVGPEYASPRGPTDAQWAEPLEAGLEGGPADLRRWWGTFNDPVLDSLVDRSLSGSLDLREAAARVREARARRGVVGADQFPTVDVNASASQNRASENSFGGFSGGPGSESDLYDIGFDATWEIDIFGRVRRSVEAADADVEAAVESARDARVVLVSEVARNYVEYRSAQARLVIAQENVKTQQDTLGLSKDRLAAGLATDLQVAQATAQLETTRSQIPRLTQALKRAAFRLDVLLGVPPGTVGPELATASGVPGTPATVLVGMPAELVRRRPDIRRAERSLAAATARVGVATADLYPRFTLSGSFGLESEDTGNLFDGDSRTWSAGPLAVRWPIFDAGRIRSTIRVNEAQQEQSLVQYERTVLQAYEEVANALVAYARVKERRESLAVAVDANRKAVELANDLWTRGLTDFLNVLDSQRALFLAEDQLAESDAEVTTSLIAIYKSLGGGWDVPEEPARASAESTSPADPGVTATQ